MPEMTLSVERALIGRGPANFRRRTAPPEQLQYSRSFVRWRAGAEQRRSGADCFNTNIFS